MSFLTIILIALVVYAFLCIIFYLIQERFLFQPEILPQDFKYKYEYPVEEVFFEPETGVRINGLHFKIDGAKGVVFYFKGNTRSIKGWGKFAKDFVNKGYDFFMIDYRGFGKRAIIHPRHEPCLSSNRGLVANNGHDNVVVTSMTSAACVG